MTASPSHTGNAAAAEPLPVVPGQVLAGKFRVERVIGEGGMGIVAEATHLGLDERVALKFLRREVMKLPDVVARFDREARAAVKLKSEHVARVSDVGKTDDGIPFMVMELLAGRDLAQLITEQGALPLQDAVEYIIQACEGVGEAHARGIVHRDLKPENLFVVQRDGYSLIKVLDFGISKAVLVGSSSVNLSSNQTTSMMGSPYYMSPEQLRSTRSVDHRADIWSLGVVLFELLTCATVWDETKEFTELVADILEAPPRKLCMFRPDAPVEVEAIIDRCLEKDRNKRFQNVAELAVALLPFAPRRARVTVERTTHITRAAGLITDPNFQIPPSTYPTNMSGSDSYPTGRVAPRPPSIPHDMSALALSETAMPPPLAQTPPPPQFSPPQSTPSLMQNVETTYTPRKQVSPVVLIFGAVLLLGVGVALAYGVIRTLKPAPVVAAQAPQTTTHTAPDAQSAKALPQTSTTETIAQTTETSAPQPPSHVATNPATNSTRTHGTAKPPATTSATQTVAPPHPTLDIQLQR